MRDPERALLATLRQAVACGGDDGRHPGDAARAADRRRVRCGRTDEFDVDLSSAVDLRSCFLLPPMPDVDLLDPNSVRLALSDLDDARVSKDPSQSGSFADRLARDSAPPASCRPARRASSRPEPTSIAPTTEDGATELAIAYVAGRWRCGFVAILREQRDRGYQGHGVNPDELPLPLGSPSTIERAVTTKRPSTELPASPVQDQLSRMLAHAVDDRGRARRGRGARRGGDRGRRLAPRLPAMRRPASSSRSSAWRSVVPTSGSAAADGDGPFRRAPRGAPRCSSAPGCRTSGSTSAGSTGTRRRPRSNTQNGWDVATTAGNIGAAYLIAYAVGQFMASQLGTRLGARTNVLVGMGVSVASGDRNGRVVVAVGLRRDDERARHRTGDRLVRQRRHDGELVPQHERGRVMGWWSTNFTVGSIATGFASRSCSEISAAAAALAALLLGAASSRPSGSRSGSCSATVPRTSGSRRSTIGPPSSTSRS